MEDTLPEKHRKAVYVQALYGTQIVPDPFRFTESCLVKAPMQGMVGGVLGGMMGMFFGGRMIQPVLEPGIPPPPSRPFNESLFLELQRTAKSGRAWSKNMASIGFLYGISECYIEKYRAKHDIVNPVAAGCATGAVMAAKAGVQGMAIGCGGFAAFSAAMEYLLDNMTHQ